MLVQSWIEVERRGISYIGTCIVRHHSNVIADLALVRITLEGIKGVADSDVGRPCNTCIRAIGIE